MNKLVGILLIMISCQAFANKSVKSAKTSTTKTSECLFKASSFCIEAFGECFSETLLEALLDDDNEGNKIENIEQLDDLVHRHINRKVHNED